MLDCFSGVRLPVLLRTSLFTEDYCKHASKRDLKALGNNYGKVHLGWSDRLDPYEHYARCWDAQCRHLGWTPFK